MRLPWNKSKAVQLDLLDNRDAADERPASAQAGGRAAGQVLLLPITCLVEDPGNPRTEFPDGEIDELAEDIRQHGILQPIVVRPADDRGNYRIHFGAKRWRAAQRAGLTEVSAVVRDTPSDPYTQVAENQKRHGLTPMDLARFIRARVDVGESNAAIARRMGMNLMSVAHHLALLGLPPELDDAVRTGRCTSPGTLHELGKLRRDKPEQVQALLASGAEITRSAVTKLRAESPIAGVPTGAAPSTTDKLIAQAHAACDRLERVLGRIQPSEARTAETPELGRLRDRVQAITARWLQGSDRQAPSQTDR